MKQLLCVILLFVVLDTSAQRIENVTFVNQGNTIVITYDFEGCTTNDTYIVQVKFKEQGGGEVIPKTLIGDIQKVTCGAKRIVWEVFKDRTNFEGKYYVELTAKVTPKVPIDADGYTYKTVQIGNQVWFAEDLRTSKYNDGTPIPNVIDATAWGNLNTGAYCFYDNNEAYNTTYGKLYNWYALETDKLCPTGWHLPKLKDWDKLVNSVGGTDYAAFRLKDTIGWETNRIGSNANGCNCFGFSSKPNLNQESKWWSASIDSSSECKELCALNFEINDYNQIAINLGFKNFCFGVRCLQEFNSYVDSGFCSMQDVDNDGTFDNEDPCPLDSGAIHNSGCPDFDGDGLIDGLDTWNKIFGDIGCEKCSWNDIDSDGILDKDDFCVNRKGLKKNKGCPTMPFDTSNFILKPDQLPTFPGGDSKMFSFFEMNSIYDNLDLQEEHDFSKYRKGCFLVKALINESGEIMELTVKNKLPYCLECNEALLKVIDNFPKLIPANYQGRKVKSYFEFKVLFSP